MLPSTYAIKSHEALTRSLSKLGYFSEALEAADRAVALGSVNRVVRLRRAWLFAQMGYVAESLAESDRALSLGAAFPRPSDEHCRALCVLGRAEEALESTRRALSNDPTDLAARCSLALLTASQGRTEEALSQLQGLEEQGGETFVGFVRVGREVLSVGS